jgi:hypothetical protein
MKAQSVESPLVENDLNEVERKYSFDLGIDSTLYRLGW